MAFYDEFGIKCDSKDNVAVSSGPLQYRVQPRGSRTTAVLCGISKIVNVSVPDREMWVRFSAGKGERKQQNIGFRATYIARGNVYVTYIKHSDSKQNIVMNTFQTS